GGIRDFHVTGVQTCALPISSTDRKDGAVAAGESTEYVVYPGEEAPQERYGPRVYTGEERWATVCEVGYLARDWHRRSKEPVPITDRKSVVEGERGDPARRTR